jgi:putative endopeptidase
LWFLAALAACGPSPVASPSAATGAAGMDVAGLDRSVAPGQDFYGYANDGWLKHHDIPPDRAGYGTDTLVEERTYKRSAELIA